MGRKRGTTEGEATGESARERSVTVTYGAFSCTLTGYKHPEEIVKALSEHFKTLAEEAPHFALPPPQVDVALLQQIAAQELRRQMDEGTIDIEAVAELAGTPMRAVDAAAEDAEIAPEAPARATAEPPANPDETPAERSARRRAATIANLRAAVAAATAAAQADRRQAARPPPPRAPAPNEPAPADPAPIAPAPANMAPEAPAAPPFGPPAVAAAAVTPAAPLRDETPAPQPDAAQRPASRLPVLRLVPDLRLDAPAEATPPAAVTPPAPDLGFEAYAARTGAQRLAERIEAAAAYLTVIEGRSRFEAAAVVSLVARHPPPDEPSDALARADAFAQLVRSGRLRRIEGNRYALTAPEMGRGAP
ncbi:MAG: hypothetical protein ACO3FX_09685 [Gemmobacter sp.]